MARLLLLFSLGCYRPVSSPTGGSPGFDWTSVESFPQDSADPEDSDAGPSDDTGTEDTGREKEEPRCEVTASAVRCSHETSWLDVGGLMREVHAQVPTGSPPAGGWPVAMLFHGSYVESEKFWSADEGDAWGVFTQAKVTAALLEDGYAVVTPEADPPSALYWDTNILPWSHDWTASPDHAFMLALFDAIDAGSFGELAGDQLFVGGLSSGGYMSSRMTLAYPERVKAVAIAGASYATCSGSLCVIPAPLPPTHAPTLLLHGALDPVVPVWTAWLYQAQLEADGIEARMVTQSDLGHAWIDESPEEVLAWFNQHH